MHGQRGLAQMGEDGAEVVADLAHHEAVEQRPPPVGAGARQDAASRLEPEVYQRFVENPFPASGFSLDLRQSASDPAPALLDRGVDRRAIEALEAVFRIPDLA